MHSISNKNNLSVVKHTLTKDTSPRAVTFLNNQKVIKPISFKIEQKNEKTPVILTKKIFKFKKKTN